MLGRHAGAGLPFVGVRAVEEHNGTRRSGSAEGRTSPCNSLQLELRAGVGLAGQGLAVANGVIHLIDDDFVAVEPGVGRRCIVGAARFLDYGLAVGLCFNSMFHCGIDICTR